MSEKLGWGSIILFKWNKEWERAAFTSHNRWKNQPRFPSLGPFNGSMEGEKGSQWTSHGASWNFRSNEPFPLCLFRAEKRHPPRRPIPRPTLLLFASWTGRGGEKKKRSFCNQDTVHRTCERSRIDHCSWHARFVIAIRHREIELAFEILQAAN